MLKLVVRCILKISRQCRASTSEFGRCAWEAGQHVIESLH